MVEKNLCCGCEACAAICPSGACEMMPDEEGFLYPEINAVKCTHCGLCNAVCPITNVKNVALGTHSIDACSGFFIDRDKHRACASGGLISAICEKFIRAGGAVAGVKYTKDFKNAIFDICENADGIEAFRSSKYTQALKGSVYRRAREILLSGKKLLFVGLPCEIGALKSFLRRDFDSLYTLELFCHGPTSPRVLREFTDDIEEKYKSKIRAFNVRYKKYGWFPPFIRVQFKNGKIFEKSFYSSTYGYAFSNLSRPSCYKCAYKGDNRAADVSVGDFIGLSETRTEYSPDGISAVLINSERGRALLKDLAGVKIHPASADYIISHNRRVVSSTPIRNRAAFSKAFRGNELKLACEKVMPPIQKIKNAIPYGIKKFFGLR